MYIYDRLLTWSFEPDPSERSEEIDKRKKELLNGLTLIVRLKRLKLLNGRSLIVGLNVYSTDNL